MNDFSSKDRYISSRGNILDVFYIAMEYAEKGELFDLILSVGKFTEQTARFLFTKILDGVSYLHNKGTSHLDIKLENILVDEEFNTKISDFGLSTSKQEIDYKAGTDIYWAPEMFTNTNFKTKPLDVFALGVVLFSMVSGKPPFTYARVDDRCFQLLNTNSKQFWKQQSKSCNVDYSSEFIELINSIFELDPAKRATIKDIKESEWLNGYLPSKDEVTKELTITRIKIKW